MILLLGLGFDAGAQFRQYGQSRSGLQDVTGDNSTLVSIPGQSDSGASATDSVSVAVDTTAGFSIKRIVRGYFR